MKKEIVNCDSCFRDFEKEPREIRRSVKLNRRQFCSRSCAGKSIGNLEHLNKINPNDYSSLNPSNRKDEFTHFRYHLRKVRSRNKEFDITLLDLKLQWESQKGICPYSKLELILKPSKTHKPFHQASLDRINSDKGYVKGNIQFTSLTINYMKGVMTDDETKHFIELLKLA